MLNNSIKLLEKALDESCGSLCELGYHWLIKEYPMFLRSIPNYMILLNYSSSNEGDGGSGEGGDY